MLWPTPIGHFEHYGCDCQYFVFRGASRIEAASDPLKQHLLRTDARRCFDGRQVYRVALAAAQSSRDGHRRWSRLPHGLTTFAAHAVRDEHTPGSDAQTFSQAVQMVLTPVSRERNRPPINPRAQVSRSEEHTSELQSLRHL